ncbi:MAG: hypothetical protein ACREKN_03640 [Longimicrobiaceae bacterium]
MTARSTELTPSPRARVSSNEDSRKGLLLAGLALGAVCVLALPLRHSMSPRKSRAPRRRTVEWETEIERLEEETDLRRKDHPGIHGTGIEAKGDRRAPGEAASGNREAVARQLSWGAAALSFSILADSAAEHYRGGFYNPAMYVAPVVSALTLLASTLQATGPQRAGRPRDALFGAAVLTGLVGLGFHSYNTSRRIGGWIWENLFYGPPVAAPLGLTAAGLMGMTAARMRQPRERHPPLLLGIPAGRLLAVGAALGLLGTALEAGVLHFRGAFHRPAMYIPVSVPPLAALVLALAALRPTPARRQLARLLLRASAVAGIAGMGFHAHGIQRSMGGWRNWSQNLLSGPPLPAPPSFTGMALAGLAGLALLAEQVR